MMSRRLVVNTPIDKTVDDDLFYLHTSSLQYDTKPNRAVTDNLFDFHISPKIESNAIKINDDKDDDGDNNDKIIIRNENVCGIDQFVDYINGTLKQINKFHDNCDPNIIKKNNRYLYYLSKVGIKCMDKN